MPVFTNKAGQKLFFAHVPKTGGTYIEDFFRQNGFECHYFATGLKTTGTRLAPQHYHRDIYEQILDIGSFDGRFISIRHPLERLLSEYRDTAGGRRNKTLSEWLDTIEPRFLADESFRTNHLRPQADFYRPDLDIYRQEGGFHAQWAERIAVRYGLKLTTLTVPRRRDSAKSTSHPPYTKQDLKRALEFCKRHYERDFELFGYDPEDAPSLQHIGMGRPAEARPLQIATLDDATVCAISQDKQQPFVHHLWRAGVISADDHILPQSMLRRWRTEVVQPGDQDDAEDIEGPAIYGGLLFKAYGHFLLETLARFWAIREIGDPDIPIVIAARKPELGGQGKAQLRPWQRDLLDILGIRNPIQLVQRPVRVKRLLLPDPGFEIGHFFHPKQERFLAGGGFAHRPQPGLKLWLSRSKLKEPTTVGIERLEHRLEQEGWTIYHPQEHSLRDQLAMLARAERISGEEGSALHTLVLLDECEKLRVDVFPRTENVTQTYETIAKAKGFQQRVHQVGRPTILRKMRRKVTKTYSDFGPFLEILTRD